MKTRFNNGKITNNYQEIGTDGLCVETNICGFPFKDVHKVSEKEVNEAKQVQKSVQNERLEVSKCPFS